MTSIEFGYPASQVPSMPVWSQWKPSGKGCKPQRLPFDQPDTLLHRLLHSPTPEVSRGALEYTGAWCATLKSVCVFLGWFGMACNFSIELSALYPPRHINSIWWSRLKAFGRLRMADDPSVTPAHGTNFKNMIFCTNSQEVDDGHSQTVRAPRLVCTTSAKSPETTVQ